MSTEQAKACLKCRQVTVPKLQALLKGSERKVEVLQALNMSLRETVADSIDEESKSYTMGTVVLVMVSSFAVGAAVGMFSVAVSK